MKTNILGLNKPTIRSGGTTEIGGRHNLKTGREL